MRPAKAILKKAQSIPLKNNGQIDEGFFLKKLSEAKHVGMIILTSVNSQSGINVSIDQLSEKIKSIHPQAHIHLDASQSFMKINHHFKDSLIDSFTISGHKLGAPKGIAAVFIKRCKKILPLLLGGDHEHSLRASTLNAPLIFSFSEVIKSLHPKIGQHYDYVSSLNFKLRQWIESELKGVRLPFAFADCSPYILTMIIKKIPSDVIIRHLEEHNIFISSTSACSSKIKTVNPGLLALNIDKKFHKNILRVSFS